MNRRNFIQKLALYTGALSLGGAWSATLYAKAKMKNWVWITIDTEAGDDEWKRRFERLKAARVDAVIPEVYNGTHAYFGSSRLPVKAEYLERLIPLAKSFGLELHAWMWVMPCMVDEIVQTHSDWYMVNALGQSAAQHPAYVDYYKFLCPSKGEVQDFICGTVKELAQYDVDGIHLDYVRYPDVILPKGLWSKYQIVQDKEYPPYDYCYCATCREQFKRQHGIDPLFIKDKAGSETWLQFRYDRVTRLVNDRIIPIVRRAGKQVSAAVFPNRRNVRQQWPAWRLDAVMPMLYNTFYLAGPEWIRQNTAAGIKALQYDTALYSGLMPGTPEQFKDYLMAAKEGGARGVSVFSLNALREPHLKLLADFAGSR